MRRVCVLRLSSDWNKKTTVNIIAYTRELCVLLYGIIQDNTLAGRSGAAMIKTENEKPNISREDWTAVQNLIKEVNLKEHASAFAASVAIWDAAVHLFRRLEQEHLIEQTPTETDLDYHKGLLHLLLGVGHILKVRAASFRPEVLKEFNLRREDVQAYVRELEMTLSDWHGEHDTAKIAALEKELLSDCAAT
jgi:hypothetical protein